MTDGPDGLVLCGRVIGVVGLAAGVVIVIMHLGATTAPFFSLLCAFVHAVRKVARNSATLFDQPLPHMCALRCRINAHATRLAPPVQEAFAPFAITHMADHEQRAKACGTHHFAADQYTPTRSQIRNGFAQELVLHKHMA